MIRDFIIAQWFHLLVLKLCQAPLTLGMLNNKEARHHLSKDVKMRPLIQALQPLDLPPSGNVFNELVKAIVYQQISYKAADSIYSRFVELMGTEKYKPIDLLKIGYEDIRSVGFSGQKTQYVQNIAAFFQENQLYDQEWSALSQGEIQDLLTQIKGVGVWTVQMILMFQLQRPDVFPTGDLGVQQAMMGIYGLTEEKKSLLKKMEELAEKWRPHRTLAALYLWSWKRENP